jgi:ABC-2 type transport system permease protein
MRALRQYADLVVMHLRMARSDTTSIAAVQLCFALGLILGFGYFVPNLSRTAAVYLTTGAATNSLVTIGLVTLPQTLTRSRADGRLEHFLTMPISREAYLLSQVTVAAVMGLPASLFCLAPGAWHYGFALHVNPAVLVVVPLAVLSLGGVGVAMGLISSSQQLTGSLTQLVGFYVLLFAPVMLPRGQLPELLRHVADFMPPTYAAGAVRGSLTTLPGTHLTHSIALMALFSAASLAFAAVAIRRRA